MDKETREALVESVVARTVATAPISEVVRVYSEVSRNHFNRNLTEEEFESLVRREFPDLAEVYLPSSLIVTP